MIDNGNEQFQFNIEYKTVNYEYHFMNNYNNRNENIFQNNQINNININNNYSIVDFQDFLYHIDKKGKKL